MEDGKTASSSSDEQMVPKARLNEVIADKRAVEAERAALQQTLTQLVQNQRAQTRPTQVEEDPYMKNLRETDPVAYKRELRREQEVQQLRAGFSGMLDTQDRAMFLQTFGKKGQKRLAEVEQILEQNRNNGIFTKNRGEIFVQLLGHERIQSEFAEENGQAPAPAPQQRAQVQASDDEDDAPSSDPRHATSAAGSSAPVSVVEKTRDERIKELENQEF